MLTSHEDLVQSTYRKPITRSERRLGNLESSKKRGRKFIPETLYRKVIIAGKPNEKIIKEKLILNSALRENLVAIIPDQHIATDSIIVEVGAACFNPHHTIFIYKNKKWSYIDLCFGCQQYDFSKDLIINKENFLARQEDWDELKNFFRELNLTYKIKYP